MAERKELLEKMRSVQADLEGSTLEPIDATKDEKIPFATQIKNESFFFRCWLWLKSLFTNTSVETLFNEYRITHIAHGVEKIAPGMLDMKRSYLLAPFYEEMKELKRCVHFFRPYVELLDENIGEYYVLLGSIVMPDIEALIDSDVDPYSIPLTPESRPELRVSLLRRLETILQEIPADAKARMYVACRVSNWLLQFVRLPFTRLLTHFNTVINGEYRCAFAPIEADLCLFSKVLYEGIQIPDEVLEALYLYSGRLTTESVSGGETTEEGSAERFMEKAHSFISIIRNFMHNVPLCSITRVVCNDAQWQPETFAGAEDWYVLYKANWKKLFERKWEAWVQDCKKEALRESLTRDFQLKEFPLLPERPWAYLWGGLPFRYELTAGFLYWFFREKFPSYEITLKTIMLEGDFVQKDNRVEYTEAYNDLIQVSINLDALNRKLQGNGEIGLVFERLANDRSHTLQGQAKAEELVREAESDISSIIYKFGEACRRINLVLGGILQLDEPDSRYDSIHNLAEIQGKNNTAFRARLAESKQLLKSAYELVKELEPIDTPTLFK